MEFSLSLDSRDIIIATDYVLTSIAYYYYLLCTRYNDKSISIVVLCHLNNDFELWQTIFEILLILSLHRETFFMFKNISIVENGYLD